MGAGGWWTAWWPSRRSALLDVALAAFFAALDGPFLYLAYQDYWLPREAVAACGMVTALTLVARRRHPVGLALFAMVFATATGGGGFAALVVLYSLGAYAASRRAAIGVAATGYVVALVVPGATGHDDSFLARAVFSLAFTALPVVLGLYMGARKQLVASLQERAARLEREQGLLTERARAEERTRIAREMHDVVANRISVMVVHAGALRAVVRRDPDRAAETAAVIGDMGRQALEELRQVIGVLRQGEERLLAAAPTLADVHALAGQSRSAGLSVRVEVRGEEGPMPPAVGTTLYRIVQEALTNVHKHAGDADTRIEVGMLPGAVEVDITNAAAAAGPRHGLPSGGNGLVGLRERVTALGGRLEAGPRDGGGYTVRARLPLPAA
ncbi:sensor histidine kinase [Actinomadura parmotrematis]|uniref:histidine kinase n=1 Tax=Actinomadura parmotrematis TaxID=2864039 RepID=A0ABS7FM85_9ACTN|nr:histidine kinase [Actinomadura parmotrematis]MBW8481110.1 sensor histidine kinase [Actinomadura parmotrematis]